jgi:hypothetical protein
MGRKRIDGSFVGPDGVQTMHEVRDILSRYASQSPVNRSTGRPSQRLVNLVHNFQLYHEDQEPVDVWIEDVASMASLGYTPEQTADKLFKERINLHEFVAVESGKVSGIISDGWL